MLEILVYAFGVMYTPGPCNLLSLNAGVNGHVRAALRFCLGVGTAMLTLFLLFGYLGAWLMNAEYTLLISALGSLYILYLAYKIGLMALREVDLTAQETPLSFKDGLFLQLLNPKSFVAILPIVSVQFPAAQISGIGILLWSLLLSIMAFGAPGSYLFMGARLRRIIAHPICFRALNLSMAVLLAYVAIEIAYSHVYLKF